MSSRSPRRSWSRARSTACSPRSIRIRATWTRKYTRTCRSRPAASSAGLACRSRWRTASSRSCRRSTTRPAAKAGVQPGDLIFALDGEPVQGMTLQEAVEKMRGKIGIAIKISIRRDQREDPIDLSLTRDDDQGRASDAPPRRRRYRLHPHHLLHRAEHRRRARRRREDLKSKAGAKLIGFVLDLRNNPGGLLDQAISVSRRFPRQGRDRLGQGPRKRGQSQRWNAQADATSPPACRSWC